MLEDVTDQVSSEPSRTLGARMLSRVSHHHPAGGDTRAAGDRPSAPRARRAVRTAGLGTRVLRAYGPTPSRQHESPLHADRDASARWNRLSRRLATQQSVTIQGDPTGRTTRVFAPATSGSNLLSRWSGVGGGSRRAGTATRLQPAISNRSSALVTSTSSAIRAKIGRCTSLVGVCTVTPTGRQQRHAGVHPAGRTDMGRLFGRPDRSAHRYPPDSRAKSRPTSTRTPSSCECAPCVAAGPSQMYGVAVARMRSPAASNATSFCGLKPFLIAATDYLLKSPSSRLGMRGSTRRPPSVTRHGFSRTHNGRQRPAATGGAIFATASRQSTGVEAWGNARDAVVDLFGGVTASASVARSLQRRRRGTAHSGRSACKGTSVGLRFTPHSGSICGGHGLRANPTVPAYTAVDARLVWRVNPKLEISLNGQNLFDAHHAEWGAAPNRVEFDRTVTLGFLWTP